MMPAAKAKTARGATKRAAPVHPGEILNDFVTDYELSARALAERLKVPPNRITGILNGERAVTADTALRLGKLFGTSAEFWINLQKLYELEVAAIDIGKTLREIEPLRAAA